VSEVPARGDLAWLIFTPQLGREQVGHRPALVLSPRIYHERSGLAVVCPITSNMQPWPWKVLLPDELPVSGAVLVDQVRSIDRGGRKLRVVGRAPEAVVLDVQAKLAALLGIGVERER
jgi:mRNA interferase MazF